MKKVKEALWFVAALLLLTGVFLGVLYVNAPSGNSWGIDYFRLMLTDGMLLVALAMGMVLPAVLSFCAYAVVSVVFLIARRKPWATRRVYYTVMAFAAFVVADIAALCRPSLFIGGLDIVMSLWAAVLVMLVFWVAESIIQAVKAKHKQREEIE